MPDPTEPRPLTAADDDALARLHALAFAFPASDAPGWWEQAGRGNVRVLDDGGRVAAGLVDLPMGIFLGGEAIPLHGIAGVVVDPAARGRGLGQRLMAGHLRQLRERGVPLSALYASTRGLYRHVGYGLAGTHHEATLPTAALRRAGEPQAGWREVGPDDRAPIEALYRRLAAGSAGAPDRSPYLWGRVWARRGGPCHAWALGGTDGVRAWVVTQQSHRPDGWLELRLVDHGAVDAEALGAVAAFVGAFASMARTTRLACGPHVPLLDRLPEHEATVALKEPWMLRVVDVPAALRARPVLPVADTVDLAVHDPTLPANEGPWRLTADDGRLRVEPTATADVRIDVRGLAGLYTGHATTAALRMRGLLEGPDAPRRTLDRWFAGPAPGMADFF